MRATDRPVLFLDVDGVVNSSVYFRTCGANLLYALDPAAVARVRHIIDVTGCAVVLSSTWRLVPEACDALRAAGIHFIDATPVLPHTNHRGEEIHAWLQAHPLPPRFAVVDDDADAGDGFDLGAHFVRTSFTTGLADHHADQLIALLGGAA